MHVSKNPNDSGFFNIVFKINRQKSLAFQLKRFGVIFLVGDGT